MISSDVSTVAERSNLPHGTVRINCSGCYSKARGSIKCGAIRRTCDAFTMDEEEYGCKGKDVLLYLKLARNGEPSGELLLLAGRGFVSGSIVNIDILQD